MPGIPTIHIVPELKELSKSALGYSMKCGSGFTNENCIADYNAEKNILEKRKDYTSGFDKLPNHYLKPGEEDNYKFKITENATIQMGKYMANWVMLKDIIISRLYKFGGEDPSQPEIQLQLQENSSATNTKTKTNVFISGHQHSFQKNFFKFKDLPDEDKTETCNNKTEAYGFRNCTCIKISKIRGKLASSLDEIEIRVIYSDDTGRDKFKYKYIEVGDLSKYLVEGTYPIIDGKNSKDYKEFARMLDTYDIYMIRHGEAIHNLDDIKKVKKIKLNCDGQKEEGENIEINEAIMAKIGKEGKSNVALNALLTDQGVAQAENLNKVLQLENIDTTDNVVYISSPMDRTIETLITATGTFLDLKIKFNTMRCNRFGVDCSNSLEGLNRLDAYTTRDALFTDADGNIGVGGRSRKRKLRKSRKMHKTRKGKRSSTRRHRKSCCRHNKKMTRRCKSKKTTRR